MDVENLTPEQLKQAYLQHNMEMTQGFKILNELEAEQKISSEKCDMLKQRFYKMHKIMADN
jgi:hypothetical protein